MTMNETTCTHLLPGITVRPQLHNKKLQDVGGGTFSFWQPPGRAWKIIVKGQLADDAFAESVKVLNRRPLM